MLEECSANKDRQISTMEGVIKEQNQIILAHDGRYQQQVEDCKHDQQQVLESIRKMCEVMRRYVKMSVKSNSRLGLPYQYQHL